MVNDPSMQNAIVNLGIAAEPDEVATSVLVQAGTTTGNVQLLEEELSVTKRQVVAGKLRVSTRTLTHDEVAETTLERDVLEVTRVPVGQLVDVAPMVRTEGNTTIVPIIEERFVVVKQLYLKEELHIRHSVERESVQETVLLRRQYAVVERVDANGRVIDQPD
ncbi:MAG: YsnF/AvaK domain-containing protein [Janthinobacterium lividum]